MRWTCSILLTLSLTAARGQYPFDGPTILTEDQGLSNSFVTAVDQDHDGFTWIGTASGVNRFDGREVRSFNQSDEPSNAHQDLVFDVFCDKAGHTWMSSIGGLFVFQPQHEKFRPFPYRNRDYLEGVWFYQFYQDRSGKTWVAANKGGIWQADLGKDTLYRHPLKPDGDFTEEERSRTNSVFAVAQDVRQDSILWLGTHNGLVRYNTRTNRCRLYRIEGPYADQNPYRNHFRSLYCHEDGKIYIAAQQFMAVFDPAAETFHKIQDLKSAPGPRYTSFCRYADDKLWLTYELGLIVYNTSTGKVERAFVNSPDDNRFYGADLKDSAGRLWVRSPVGLFLYRPLAQQIKSYQHDATSHVDYGYLITDIVESRDQRTLFICESQGEGIFAFDRETEQWSVIVAPPAAMKNRPFLGQGMTRLRNGRILVLESYSLFELNENNRKLVRLPLASALPPGAEMVEILEDRRGNIWISTRRDGLLRVDPQTWRAVLYKGIFDIEGFDKRHELIFGLKEDRLGQVWMSASPGLSIYRPDQDDFIQIVKTPFAQGDPKELFYTCFATDGRGNVWAASADWGICMFDPGAPEKGVLEWYDDENGLPTFPLGMAVDRTGNIWMSGNKGLVRFDPQAGAFNEYGVSYGYSPKSQGYIRELPSGLIAIGVNKGFSLFDPASLQLNREIPVPYFTSVKVFDREVGARDSTWHYGDLNLSYRQNFFSFEFSAIAYDLPESVQFAYKLEGVDKDWVQAGNRRYASYTNIPGGDYTFRVRAANSEGLWHETPAALHIRITTPWWRTWWFFALLGLGLAGVITGIYRFRIGQFKKQHQLKTEYEKQLANVKMDALRSQINPHFIFNCLNSIDYYIIKNESQKASEYLNQFSRLIRLILQNSSANSVTLKDELEALQLYMQMESLRFNNRFDYIVKVEKGLNLEALEIPPMLLQPYVENAIWHGLMNKGDKGKISVEVTRENGFLSFAVEDNGIGRKKAEALKSKNATKKRSMGMNITRNRIELLNQMFGRQTTVKIIDLEGEDHMPNGTRVELSIPIN